MIHTSKIASAIQIGDNVKVGGFGRYFVVEAIADKPGANPARVFLLDDGATYRVGCNDYVWWQPAE